MAGYDFVNLGFLSGSLIPGTACDQRLFHGNVDTAGTITSPSFRQENITCSYTFIGQSNSRVMEVVEIRIVNISGCLSFNEYDKINYGSAVIYEHSNDTQMNHICSFRGLGAWTDYPIVSNDSVFGFFVPWNVQFAAEYMFIPRHEWLCHGRLFESINSESGSIELPTSEKGNKLLTNLDCTFSFITTYSEALLWQLERSIWNSNSRCESLVIMAEYICNQLDCAILPQVREIRPCYDANRVIELYLLPPASSLRISVLTKDDPDWVNATQISYVYKRVSPLLANCMQQYDYTSKITVPKLQINLSTFVERECCVEVFFGSGFVWLIGTALKDNPVCIVILIDNQSWQQKFHNACLNIANETNIFVEQKRNRIRILFLTSRIDNRPAKNENPDVYLRWSRATKVTVGSDCRNGIICHHLSANESVCIPRELVCDGQIDCPGGLDEKFCLKPDGSTRVHRAGTGGRRVVLGTVILFAVVALVIVIYLVMAGCRRAPSTDSKQVFLKTDTSDNEHLVRKVSPNSKERVQQEIKVDHRNGTKVDRLTQLRQLNQTLRADFHTSSFSSIEGELAVCTV